MALKFILSVPVNAAILNWHKARKLVANSNAPRFGLLAFAILNSTAPPFSRFFKSSQVLRPNGVAGGEISMNERLQSPRGP